MKITEPNTKFEEGMLDPKFWKWGGDIDLHQNIVISTDEWIKMQEAALRYAKDLERNGCKIDKFLMNIIDGIVPNELRITRPDPIKNMR